jgi:AraC family transcriptional regulator
MPISEEVAVSEPALFAYRLRFRKVLEHIDAHLDDDLSVERLSAVAASSKYHFHRQFSLLLGISVHKYVQLVRLRRAAYLLAFRSDERILDVAFASGYESHEAFSLAFKKAVGQTPSEFRDQPEWEPWHAADRRLTELRSFHMKPAHSKEEVSIVTFPETRVAVLEHRGDPARIGDSVRTFIEWRKQNGASPKVSATFNVLYDDPNETSPDQFRLDLCAGIERPVADNPFGVVEKKIPAGRCAVLRHVGSDDTLGESLRYLYSTWLPASGEEPRDFPLFLQRVRFFPDVPEHEAVLDVFLPLR